MASSKRWWRATQIVPEVLTALKGYRWPGNIRELNNLAERMTILCPGDSIGLGLLPEEITHDTETESHLVVPSAAYVDDYREARQQFETHFLTQKSRQHKGNMAATARTIGMHPPGRRRPLPALETFFRLRYAPGHQLLKRARSTRIEMPQPQLQAKATD